MNPKLIQSPLPLDPLRHALPPDATTWLPRCFAAVTAMLLSTHLAAQERPAPAAGTERTPAQVGTQGVQPAASATPSYGLGQLLALAREGNPALLAERARWFAAQASVRTARAWPNPELDFQQGRQSSRQAGGASGSARTWSVTQALEAPSLRSARTEAAQADVDVARAGLSAFELNILADLKQRYFQVLRLQAEARNAERDLTLAEQIHARVKVRVDTGEAARFELIRADAERLNAQRARQASLLRVQQAKSEVRRFVGLALPADFNVQGNIEDAPTPPPALEPLRERLLSAHPELVAARAAVRAAQARQAQEEARRLPGVAVRVGDDRTPDARTPTLGLVVSVPLFDRREGPIAQAQAEVAGSRNRLADRELQLTQALDIAWQRFQIANGQVLAYESGIVRQAEAALRTAEAAYRYGERGILEYLDAQRAYRQVRNDLNAVRYELREALVELERLDSVLPDAPDGNSEPPDDLPPRLAPVPPTSSAPPSDRVAELAAEPAATHTALNATTSSRKP